MAVSKPSINTQYLGKIPAGNYGGKRGIRPTHITEHHIVGDANAAIGRFTQAGQQASSTFVIGSNGTIYQLLQLDDWPYTDANATSNRRAITIEHAGGHANVPYTEAMYKSTIHLQAWLRQEFGIPEGNMLMHKQVSDTPTACPGGLDVARIKRESSALLQGVPQVTNPSITTLRIVQSEVTGTDRNYVHSGQFDKAMQDAHGWKDVNEFVYEMWQAGGGYRMQKDEWKKFYDNFKPQIDELLSRPTKAQYDQLVTANGQQAEQIKKLQAELALQSEDTKNLNALGAALQWAIMRLGLSKKES